MTTLKPQDVDGVAVLCEKCGTAIAKQSESEAKETAHNHNATRHAGENVAQAITTKVDVDTSKVTKEQRERFVQQIMGLL